jgi:hypothetical protein
VHYKRDDQPSERKLTLNKYTGRIHYHWECCGQRWTEAALEKHRTEYHKDIMRPNVPK